MLLASISSGGGAPALIAACTGILAGKQSVWGGWMHLVASHSSSDRLPGECHMAGTGRGPHAWPPLSGTCKSGNERRGDHVQVGLHIASPHQLEQGRLAIKFIK